MSLKYYRRRRDYTRKEKVAIINFITKYRFHNSVKGREIWQKAEAAQVCVPVVPSHTSYVLYLDCVSSAWGISKIYVYFTVTVFIWNLVTTLYTVTLEKYTLGKNCVCIPPLFCFSNFLILLQICPNRTWQSMKEHFIKQIIPNIETYEMSEEEIRKFRNP